MSDSRNWNGTGEQIKSALSEALQSGDFKNLNDLVSQTVTDAINAAGKHVSSGILEACAGRPLLCSIAGELVVVFVVEH